MAQWQKSTWLILSGLVSVVFFFLLPSWWKILAFLLPALTIAWAYAGKNWLNPYILLFESLLFVLFPSSLVSLNATSPFVANVQKIFSTLTIIEGVVVYVPIVLATVALIAEIGTAQWDKALNLGKMLIIVICLLIILANFAALLDLNVPWLNWMKDIVKWIWDTIIKIPGIQENLPEEIQNTDLTKFSAITVTPEQISLTITSVFPLIISGTAIIMGLVYKQIHKDPTPFIDLETPTLFHRPRKWNYAFFIIAALILIGGLMLYLSFGNEALTYTNIAYFSIYLTITVFCCILMGFGVGSPTDNSRISPLGIIFVISLMFLVQNMFTQVITLDMIVMEYSALTITTNSIISQFLFVGPTESLMFQVFVPSFGLMFLLERTILTDPELNNKIVQSDTIIQTLQNLAAINQQLNQNNEYALVIQELNEEQKKNKKLKKESANGIKLSLPPERAAIYVVIVLISNFGFACLHYWKSGIDFTIFWLSGIGPMYLLGGLIISYGCYRFGWISGVLAHSIFNSILLILSLVMSGVF
jgi:hypothetical protein